MLVKRYCLHEVHTRIWCDPDELRDLGLSPEDNVKLLGASEEKETGILRRSMMQSFLPLVYKNRGYDDTFGIFEIGRCVDGTDADGSANERRRLGIALYSKEMTERALYMEGVDIVNTIVSELKHKSVEYCKTVVEHTWQHPKNTTKLSIQGTEIGRICTLHPATLRKIAKNCFTVLIEIDMDIFDSIEVSDLEFDEPSRFPAVDYDLSLVVPEGVRFDDMSSCWDKKNNPELKKVSVIDIYDAADSKSVTIRFSFVLDDRTLTGEEVQARIDAITEKLAKMNVTLRV